MPLEGLRVLAIAVAELLVAQRQVATRIGLYAQQVGLGARRHQGRRHTHLVGVADLLSCLAAPQVAQPDDQQGQHGQELPKPMVSLRPIFRLLSHPVFMAVSVSSL